MMREKPEDFQKHWYLVLEHEMVGTNGNDPYVRLCEYTEVLVFTTASI